MAADAMVFVASSSLSSSSLVSCATLVVLLGGQLVLTILSFRLGGSKTNPSSITSPRDSL